MEPPKIDRSASTDPSPDEQSEADRLRIARRYRETRGAELRQLAAPHLEGEVLACGSFSGDPFEAMAAVPIFGVFVALWKRLSRRGDAPASALVALEAEHFHLLRVGLTDANGRKPVDLVESWPRSSVSVGEVTRKFARELVRFEIAGRDQDLKLYASGLKTNPWAAEVVRMLGGQAPEPLDLSDPGRRA